MRQVLILGKYAVKGVSRRFGKLTFALDLGGPTMEIKLPGDADVREGDLLTIYTEVLGADTPHNRRRPTSQR
jgi:hypothetical protein